MFVELPVVEVPPQLCRVLERLHGVRPASLIGTRSSLCPSRGSYTTRHCPGVVTAGSVGNALWLPATPGHGHTAERCRADSPTRQHRRHAGVSHGGRRGPQDSRTDVYLTYSPPIPSIPEAELLRVSAKMMWRRPFWNNSHGPPTTMCQDVAPSLGSMDLTLRSRGSRALPHGTWGICRSLRTAHLCPVTKIT